MNRSRYQARFSFGLASTGHSALAQAAFTLIGWFHIFSLNAAYKF